MKNFRPSYTKSLRPVLFSLLFSGCIGACAQNTDTERTADFNAASVGNAVHFQAILPPLQQLAGAPAAFYTYHWEFGDGTFSTEAAPIHVYARPGEYTALLDVTNHYDDGKVPRKKKKKAAAKVAGTEAPVPGVFQNGGQAIALKTNRAAKATEEITLTCSYRNTGTAPTDGRLYLFFNEKKYPDRHFAFMEARTHFGEIPDDRLSMSLPAAVPFAHAPTAVADVWPQVGAWPHRRTGVETIHNAEPPPLAATALLDRARSIFREEQSWQFSQLGAGATRNLFVSLLGTEKMLKDLSATIYVQAIFEPSNPQLPPEAYTLELEIVHSHDPNRIRVSDTRVNYRTLGSKNMDYKVKFQNNGEGPATTVQVTISVPKGLDVGKMRPVDWYPKCPVCRDPKTTGSCLETASSDNGLVFTFRNIYLPGSRQKGVTDYDSTQGFVKYRIEPEKRMAKRSFSSRADIVFDKNPPVITNYTRTRFKIGISPGIKVGYNAHPDSIQAGYPLLGFSLSPYKSWKVYPQLELLTGFRGQTELPKQDPVVTVYPIVVQGTAVLDSTVTRTFTRTTGSVSAELPLLLRKNFTRFLGLGIGGGLRYVRRNEQSEGNIAYEISRGKGVDKVVVRKGATQIPLTSTARTELDYIAFADLTLGMVRAGLNAGLRGGYRFLNERDRQPFAQLSLEIKL
jgi:hypothetical protein